MVVQFDHVNLVRKINTDNSAYLFENYYTVSNKPHSSTYMFICEFCKLFKFIWLIFNLDSCQKLTNTKSIQLPGGNNPNAWCIGRPKITTTPRFQNANFHFYHELIPKAAMMKRIPKWKHEGNSGLRKCGFWACFVIVHKTYTNTKIFRNWTITARVICIIPKFDQGTPFPVRLQCSTNNFQTESFSTCFQGTLRKAFCVIEVTGRYT